MKLLGLVLLTVACAGIGRYASLQLLKRAEELERLLQMLTQVELYLQGERLPLDELLPMLQEAESQREFPFLLDLLSRLKELPAPEAWIASVYTVFPSGHPAQMPLLRFGDVLGRTALEGQLTALRICRTALADAGKKAAEDADRRGPLFQKLGVLGGLLLAILLC